MRLGLGLRRSLICFAPLAFVPQRQKRASILPSPLVFLPISTHFTTTPEVPDTPLSFYPDSIVPNCQVELGDLKNDLSRSLRDTLRPVNPDNARTLRITATAGT